MDGQEKPPELPPLPPTPIKQEGPERDSLQSSSDSVPQTNSNDESVQSLQDNRDMTSQDIPLPQDHSNNIQTGQMSLNIPQHLSDDDFKADHMDDHLAEHISPDDYRAIQQQMGLHQDGVLSHHALQNADSEMLYDDMAIDPQIMEQIQAQIAAAEFEQQDQAFQMPPPQHHGMQHFDSQRPPLTQHQDIHSDPGPRQQFGDPNTMQQPSSHDPRNFSQHQSPTNFSQPSSQYISPVQQPHMMPNPVPDDHIMSGQLDGEGGGGMNNMQQIRHVLSMEYMNTGADGTNQYSQQRQ